MGLESTTYIDGLVSTNPVSGDNVSQGDDHLRLLKAVLKATFPNATKPFRFPSVETFTTNDTLASTDDNKIIVGNGAAGNITLTLPSLAAGDAGWSILVYNAHASNDTIIAPPSGTISGDANVTLDVQYATVEISWTGSVYIYNQELLVRTLKNLTADRVLGRVSTGGAVQQLTLGTGLAFSGSSIVTTLQPPMMPQGRLSMLTGAPRNVADVTAGTAIYYVPCNGPFTPIYNGSSWEMISTGALTLTLNSTPHQADTNYDVFIAEDPGVADSYIIGTGPAWNTSTPGSATRGTGAGTTEIEYFSGLLTNAEAIDLKNNATTYSNVPANRATYIGSFRVDAVAAQLTCTALTATGALRKWGLWNAYNRLPIVLQGYEDAATWVLSSTTVSPFNADATNAMEVFAGLLECPVDVEVMANAVLGASANNFATVGVGLNVSNAFTTNAFRSWGGHASGTINGTLRSRLQDIPRLGSTTYYAVHALAAGTTNTTFQGGVNNNQYTASFMA
jgi:hypothetical protein